VITLLRAAAVGLLLGVVRGVFLRAWLRLLVPGRRPGSQRSTDAWQQLGLAGAALAPPVPDSAQASIAAASSW
jgi:hypothetical protein